ncbi:hypothetical protein [Vreelandella janggokensis]|uniref:hypothetical protein n=1 Tax=Vreelandella janggokensis TaxID=370767 RepID=UPI002864C774|nr:hypothetical protein [Halomonas janggokensis]MDR5886434.1 hypothetical protein [Halomonas janggokensis]
MAMIDDINEEKFYTRYSDTYLQEAIAIAVGVGVAAAPRELGIDASHSRSALVVRLITDVKDAQATRY